MQSIERMSQQDVDRVENLRGWVKEHYDDQIAYESVEGKLQIIRTILENNWIEKEETLKLQALGIAFGDALEQKVAELSWVAVEDEFGRDPALQWLDTTTLAFPMTSISKRVEDGEEVDVFKLFGQYWNGILSAVEEAD